MNKAEEQKEAGRRLFQTGRFSEAVPQLKSAVEAFPNDEVLWSQLVLAASRGGQHEEAVAFATRAVAQLPRSDWHWRQLGSELTFVDRLEEAETALDNSRSLNPSAAFLWRYYAALYRKRKNLEREIEALETLVALDEANSTDLNQLGIAYHDHKNFAKALEFYRRSAATEPSVAPLFNMGLVFNDPEVSQDLDAADAYHRALAINPDYERARERLEATKKKLGPLAESARAAAAHLLQTADCFRFYLSPIELLQIDAVETAQDARAIQRAKNRLLQEIELNDCKVPWLDNHPLDRSRALAVVDELDDKTRRRFHTAIFANKPLLRFLTRGEIDHFLYSEAYFPQETLKLLDEEPEFTSFLSKPFAQQYSLVLARAIEQRALAAVEALFDGRRWVEHEDEVNICFDGAHNLVNELVDLHRSRAEEVLARRSGLCDLEEFLTERSIPELFNLLPTEFRLVQTKLVEEIRSLAVSCYNKHEDAELSRGVLNLCKRFKFKSEELNERLAQDFKTIERIVSQEQLIKHIATARQPNREASNGRALGWLVVVAIFIILGITGSFSSRNTASKSSTYTPTIAPNRPAYSPPSSPSASDPGSKSVFRVPSSVSAELNRDEQAIEREKVKAEQIVAKLESLQREIEQKQSILERTNQSAVDEFNRKVDDYNGLLERFRAQERLVNQLVESYNAKLRKHGR